MKILQLSQQFPFPETDGGKIGIASIYRELSKLGAEMTFLCYNSLKTDRKDIDEAETYGKVIFIKHPINNSKIRILKSIFDNKPIYIRKHFNNKIKKQIEDIIKNIDFDIIHTDHTAMAEMALYIKELTGKPISLRLHNIEWKIWDRYKEELKFLPYKKYIERQAKLLKNYEEEALAKFDVLLPITPVDYTYLQKFNLKNKIAVAGAGVDIDKWKPEQIDRNKNEIIIATTYNWVHNVDGLIWFIEKVLPIVKQHNPNAFLTLIGKDMPDSLKRYPQNDVNPIGFVDKVQPYLNKAGIYINPLFVGAGIRIKIIEAMAMQLPVVATSVAAEGIEANEMNGLFRADNEYDFAHQILKLMNDEQLWQESSINVRNLIESKYKWTNSVSLIYDIYNEILN